MLVIQAQGKHSPCVTLPDRFIGVDDVNSPLSTPAFAEILFGQREAVMSLMVSNEANPRHTFDSAEMVLSLISTAAKSIARRSGERGSTTRPIGRSSPWALRCRRPFRARRLHLPE